MLIAQDYSDDDSDRLFDRDLLPLFRDPRYIRVGGRPLLLVYRSDADPERRGDDRAMAPIALSGRASPVSTSWAARPATATTPPRPASTRRSSSRRTVTTP